MSVGLPMVSGEVIAKWKIWAKNRGWKISTPIYSHGEVIVIENNWKNWISPVLIPMFVGQTMRKWENIGIKTMVNWTIIW